MSLNVLHLDRKLILVLVSNIKLVSISIKVHWYVYSGARI